MDLYGWVRLSNCSYIWANRGPFVPKHDRSKPIKSFKNCGKDLVKEHLKG